MNMKRTLLIVLFFTLSVPFSTSGDEPLNNKIEYDLAKPLLIIKERKGFLACAYINAETCNKTGEACAIVSGVNNHDEMKNAKVIAISKSAETLGINIGDTGVEALEKMR
jgi:uncharacterized protein YunC (DUF1805 family)